MAPRFNRVTIVGLGLIGGSLGMAIRRKRLARQVMGLSRSAATVRRAKMLGVIDTGTTEARRAVEGADLVVVATPVERIVPCASKLAHFMRPGSVLTDVGSSKAEIVRALERWMPRGVAFVGGHPLAGSEQRGLGAASRSLFDGSTCILTKTARTRPAALARVARLWRPLTRRVRVLSPVQHDRLLAAVSHLPHLLAYALAGAVPQESLSVAPRSFLEVTRIAQSDPELWDDIFISNRTALLASMAAFAQECKALRRDINRSNHAALRRRLMRAKARRDAF